MASRRSVRRGGSTDRIRRALQAIADLLAVPREDRRKLFDWSNQMLASDDSEYGGAPDVAAAEILGYAMEMAHDRLKNPKDDIITKLVHANMDGEKLGEDQFGYFVIMLNPNPHPAFGGHGAHYCIGAKPRQPRGRGDVQRHRGPDADIVQTGEPSRLRHGWINGIKHLPVKYA